MSDKFTVDLYFANESRNPNANASIILAAIVTTRILASEIRCKLYYYKKNIHFFVNNLSYCTQNNFYILSHLCKCSNQF